MLHPSLKKEETSQPGNPRLTFRFSPEFARKLSKFLTAQQKELRKKKVKKSKSKILEKILEKQLKL
jgi:mRNA-degrading endonuclease RelE of RelBE toxin-antitoxin system